METLKQYQLKRLQKIIFQLYQTGKICENKKHSEILNKIFRAKQLIFKYKL